jgi:electron transport complex protein RnfB
MNEAQSDIYRKLQQHLDKFPIGFPPTESGIEIELLKHLFSPDEAKIACKLSDSYEPSEIIYERVKNIVISIDDLTCILDKMVKK